MNRCFRFEFGDPLQADRVDRATQFLDAAAKPLQIVFGDAVVLDYAERRTMPSGRANALVSNNFAVIGSA